MHNLFNSQNLIGRKVHCEIYGNGVISKLRRNLVACYFNDGVTEWYFEDGTPVLGKDTPTH